MGETLEQLEEQSFVEPEFESYLVMTCHRLWKKPIDNFSVEDLRIMIGQNLGLEHLVPIALKVLREDPLAEGDFFPGDLLSNVISCDEEYLKTEPRHVAAILHACAEARPLLAAGDRRLIEKCDAFIEKWQR